MTPIASDDRGTRRTATVKSGYACPVCPGTVRRVDQSMRCDGCGHVPRHGAD